MIERSYQTEILNRVRWITDPSGLDEMDILHWSGQVSRAVDDFIAHNPLEMLPKTTEEIAKQILAGRTVMAVSPEGMVLYHGTAWPNFEDGEDKILGYQVAELGTWWTHPEFRGFGLGGEGCKRLLDLTGQRWGNLVSLATNKRVNAARAGRDGGMVAVPWNNFPYLSYLTCTCVTSERNTPEGCLLRRSPDEVINGDLKTVGAEGGKMHCTLLISDIPTAQDFESRCCSIHGAGAQDSGAMITQESVRRIGEFFTGLKSHV